MIELQALRQLLKIDLPSLEALANQDQTETAYKALIIKEFMQERGYNDEREGLRAFFAFQRNRLQQLGFSKNI